MFYAMQHIVQYYFSRFIVCYSKERPNIDVKRAQVKEMFQLGFTMLKSLHIFV